MVKDGYTIGGIESFCHASSGSHCLLRLPNETRPPFIDFLNHSHYCGLVHARPYSRQKLNRENLGVCVTFRIITGRGVLDEYVAA